MNEVDRLQELRAGLPGPRAEKRNAARAALFARIESSGEPVRPGMRLAWHGRKLRIAVAGLALAATAAVASITGLAGHGDPEPAVARVLHQVANVAVTQQSQSPGPGQFFYSRSRGAYLLAHGYSPDCEKGTPQRPCHATEEWSVLVPSEHEVWVAVDRFRWGRVRDVIGEPRFVSEGQRAGWVAAGSPPLPREGYVDDTTLAGSVPDYGDLPTDPAALREAIEAREIPGVEGPPGEAKTFVLMGGMLGQDSLPSAVRAALYQAMAELPEIELLGEVEDSIGRPGTGIAYTDQMLGTRDELIFDPENSALLGERRTIVRSGAYGFEAPPGTVIGYGVNLESKVVDSVGEGAPRGAGARFPVVRCYESASLDGNVVAVTRSGEPFVCSALVPDPYDRDGDTEASLVPCGEEGSTVTHVFPGSDPALCDRLGLEYRP